MIAPAANPSPTPPQPQPNGRASAEDGTAAALATASTPAMAALRRFMPLSFFFLERLRGPHSAGRLVQQKRISRARHEHTGCPPTRLNNVKPRRNVPGNDRHCVAGTAG